MHSTGANNFPFCRYNLRRDFFHIKKKSSAENKEGFNWPAVKARSIFALEADILIFILPLMLANVKELESHSVSTRSNMLVPEREGLQMMWQYPQVIILL